MLDIESFKLGRREKVLLSGPSGSGKSTLLALLSGVAQASSGRIEVLGSPFSEWSAAKRDAFRAERLGVIFQMFNLLPYLSVLDNVLLPCRFSKVRREQAQKDAGDENTAARALLARLGLTDEVLIAKPVRKLSVGQQQRVAAARALIGGPQLIIADEPTSALDWDARDAFLTLLTDECTRREATLLFVSHDRTLGGHFDRTVELGVINRAASRERAA